MMVRGKEASNRPQDEITPLRAIETRLPSWHLNLVLCNSRLNASSNDQCEQSLLRVESAQRWLAWPCIHRPGALEDKDVIARTMARDRPLPLPSGWNHPVRKQVIRLHVSCSPADDWVIYSGPRELEMFPFSLRSPPPARRVELAGGTP